MRMETPTSTSVQSSPLATVAGQPTTAPSHQKLYISAGVVIGVCAVVGSLAGMYLWQDSVRVAEVSEVTSQKVQLEQELVALKKDNAKEKQRADMLAKEVLALTPVDASEKELLAMFKKMITYKYNVSATSTLEMVVNQKTESNDAYKIGVGINCKVGATLEENQGCAGIEKFYKRKDGTWMIVGFNDGCPVDAESEALCAKAGF